MPDTAKIRVSLPVPKRRVSWDAIGMVASALCMVHCLALPALLAAVPWLLPRTVDAGAEATELACICANATCPACVSAARAVEPPSLLAALGAGNVSSALQDACCSSAAFSLHLILFVGVVPIAVVALGAGYRRHGEWVIPLLGAGGALLLAIALFCGQSLLDGQGDQVFTIAGSVMLVSAHFWNRQNCQCCSASPRPMAAV